ncbi:MAG TPA: DUF1800 family protein [Phycisphaerae bacterium]|nr:DUF1800 family protein [Phycisphaerae bacterium]
MSGKWHHQSIRIVALFSLFASGCDDQGGSGLLDNLLPGQSTLDQYDGEFTADDAYHLYRRAAFGASASQIDAAVARGLEATVDELLTIRTESREFRDFAATYEDDIPKRWMIYLLQGNNPLRERLGLFWHDRFATSRRVLTDRDRNLSITHFNMIRSYALGNYRDFLQALTLDPLMLIWLDGANSPKQDPNENYAREFWELFTLGRDVLYTEADIREAARAFTGITLFREQDIDARPVFDLMNHDETTKSIFPERAEAANFDYISVIDLTLQQAEAPAYVARNLFALYVHDQPTDDQVKELADLFVESDFEISPLVRKILLSKAFFDESARGNQVTTPVEHIVGVARTLDMRMASEDSQGFVLDRLVSDLADAGQEMLNPPGVNGWDEGLAWMEDQWVLSRVSALGRTMEYGPDRTPELPYHILPRRSSWNDRESRKGIVDAIAAAFHLDLTAEEHEIYVEVLDQNGYLAFHLENPDYQPHLVQELLKLMAMHEDVIGR